MSLEQDTLIKLQQEYDLADIVRTGRIDGGLMGSNYWIETKDQKYFVRKYRPYSKERIQEIHRAKKYFYDNGIPASLPVLTESGETMVAHKGGVYSLFKYIDGRHIDRSEMNERHIATLGSFLGGLHKAVTQTDNVVSEKENVWNRDIFIESASVLKERIQHKKHKDAFDRSALEVIALKMQLAENNDTEYAIHYPLILCHNDYHETNVFFNSQDEISLIFDFEKVQYGTRAKEVARTLELLFFRDDHTGPSMMRARQFLSAYRSVVPMMVDEFRDGLEKRYLNMMHTNWIQSEYYSGNRRVDILQEWEQRTLRFYSENRKRYVKQLFS